MSTTDDTYAYWATRAHWRMDAALGGVTSSTRRYYARIAMVAAQSARERATTSFERAEVASLISEAEGILR